MQFLCNFVQFDKWYYMRIFCSYSVLRISVLWILSDTQHYLQRTTKYSFLELREPLICNHIVSLICFCNTSFIEKEKVVLVLQHDHPSFFIIALCNSAVIHQYSPYAIVLRHKKAVTAFLCNRNLFKTLLCVTPPLH